MLVHYQNSLLRPQVSLLRQLQAKPVLDRAQRPIVVQGRHSLVARVARSDGTQAAVRLLLDADVDAIEVTYAGLRRLSLTSLRGRIPQGAEVRRDAIDVDGRVYPVVISEWISGPTLSTAVAKARQAGNRNVLRALANAVVELASALRKAGIAHRNLQPDNLIVSSTGALVAVGLDSATWPDGPAPGTDRDVPAYLHPQDDGAGYARDAFATLLIVTSLQVMAENPALAATFGDPQGTPGGSLLFSSWDLADPGRSRAFNEIAPNVSAAAREYVDALRQACVMPLSDIERWARVIPDLGRLTHRESELPRRTIARTPEPDPEPEVEEIAPEVAASWNASGWDVAQAVERAQQRLADQPAAETSASGWNASEWGSWGQPGRETPPIPAIPTERPQPRRRVVREEPIAPPPAQEAEPVVEERPTRRRRRPVEEAPVVAPEPIAISEPVVEAEIAPRRRPLVAPARVETIAPIPEPPVIVPMTPAGVIEDRALLREALNRRNLDEVERMWERLQRDPVAQTWSLEVSELRSRRLRELIVRESDRGDDAAVLRLAEAAEENLAVLNADIRRRVRESRERLGVQRRLELALVQDARDELAAMAVSGELMSLGDTDRGSLRKVLRAIDWPMLERAIATDDDQLILAAYDPSIFETDVPDDIEARIDLARERVQWRTNVRKALKERDAEALATLFTKSPMQAIDRLSQAERRRARLLIEQARALRALDRAIAGDDDNAIVTALNRVERVGARIPDKDTWTAIQSVVERETLADDLIEAASADPFDVGRVAQLLPAARALGMAQDPRLVGEFDLGTLERKVLRQAHIQRIRAALARDDDAAIVVAAVPDPYGVLDELEEHERDRIAAAIVARRRIDREGVAHRFEREVQAS